MMRVNIAAKAMYFFMLVLFKLVGKKAIKGINNFSMPLKKIWKTSGRIKQKLLLIEVKQLLAASAVMYYPILQDRL